MLHYETIADTTLQLLKHLQELEELRDFSLVGGTSLALQIGHRISIDLDFFSSSEFDISQIPDLINHLGKVRIVNQTKSILNLYINDLKVDFVSYQYKLLKPRRIEDNLILASIPDIAAMKLAAIAGRGSRKDFIDLYFLLKQYSLPEIFDFYTSKYSDGSSFLVYKSLTYFEDAEIEPMPKMLKSVDWEEIKKTVISEVRTHFP